MSVPSFRRFVGTEEAELAVARGVALGSIEACGWVTMAGDVKLGAYDVCASEACGACKK